jgi:hypothetical protein
MRLRPYLRMMVRVTHPVLSDRSGRLIIFLTARAEDAEWRTLRVAGPSHESQCPRTTTPERVRQPSTLQPCVRPAVSLP